MILRRILSLSNKDDKEIELAIKRYPNLKSFISDEANLRLAVNSFIATYGFNLFSPSISGIYSKKTEMSFIERAANTTNSLLSLLSIGFFVILAIILLIISNIMILENKISVGISTLLGFRRSERFLLFFSFYVPILFLGSLIVVPFVFLIISPFNSFLANAFSFVVPLSLRFTDVVSMLILVMTLFMFVLYYSFSYLKRIGLSDIIRGE